ncbi:MULTISPECIES: GlcG/HbpS family heme-binding protein [unclassified Nocardioides]|uniref:GlcG/HbpS family heme-binding protein n=1 Tax=unclassified Nocardioides TaxID=2615069 RepID=UPI0018862886|nr:MULTISPECIES: heme-binding protein [unclassified Nocardioides]
MAAAPTYAEASRVLEVALEHAGALGVCVSVAVVDLRGADVLVARSDGATWFTSGVARAKARTAALFERPSDELAVLREKWPELLDVVAADSGRDPVTLPGGVPLRRGGPGGEIVGAVGVSGALPEQDLACARAAAAALVGP